MDDASDEEEGQPIIMPQAIKPRAPDPVSPKPAAPKAVVEKPVAPKPPSKSAKPANKDAPKASKPTAAAGKVLKASVPKGTVGKKIVGKDASKPPSKPPTKLAPKPPPKPPEQPQPQKRPLSTLPNPKNDSTSDSDDSDDESSEGDKSERFSEVDEASDAASDEESSDESDSDESDDDEGASESPLKRKGGALQDAEHGAKQNAKRAKTTAAAKAPAAAPQPAAAEALTTGEDGMAKTFALLTRQAGLNGIYPEAVTVALKIEAARVKRELLSQSKSPQDVLHSTLEAVFAALTPHVSNDTGINATSMEVVHCSEEVVGNVVEAYHLAMGSIAPMIEKMEFLKQTVLKNNEKLGDAIKDVYR